MKKIKYLIFSIVSLVLISSCVEDYTDAAGIKDTGGAMIAIGGNSDGKLLGAPSSSDLENATISFSDTNLNLDVVLLTGGQDVSGYELVKSFNGGNEVTVLSSNTLPMNLSYTSLADFIDGLGITADQLRIGDVIKFRTKIIKNDGSVYFAAPNQGDFNVTINCSSNLEGTYLVTNDYCMPSYMTTITANPDGSWNIESGDGAFLHLCTGNSTLINWANINVVCGEVQATGDLRFGSANSGYDIGDISGGTWDGVNGVLTMQHTQTFTGNWASSWTSTYTRQ